MKKNFTLFAFTLWAITQSFGQICTPDSTVIGADFPVQPLPLTADNPDGGIQDTACIGEFFDFTFSAFVGDTLDLGAIPLVLDSIRMAPTGAIVGLPMGLEYSCNPPSCVFIPNELGCIYVSGMVDQSVSAGTFPLELTVTAFANTGLALPVTLPNPLLFPGEYNLEVGNCSPSSTDDVLSELVQTSMVPNPVQDRANLNVNSQVTSTTTIEIMNLTGSVIFTEKVNLNKGTNTIDINTSNFKSGLFVYVLSNQFGAVSGKFVVAK